MHGEVVGRLEIDIPGGHNVRLGCKLARSQSSRVGPACGLCAGARFGLGEPSAADVFHRNA